MKKQTRKVLPLLLLSVFLRPVTGVMTLISSALLFTATTHSALADDGDGDNNYDGDASATQGGDGTSSNDHDGGDHQADYPADGGSGGNG
ncbi:hypothetical protein [Pantoea ananatis]|uniref:hypothetical protein n=1 Tax=Pantoea ananas TaxID=553 RepID=UPI0005C64BAA|nr:hypothetical protein [Pantoea ananatis]